jgi:hypothetical protein
MYMTGKKPKGAALSSVGSAGTTFTGVDGMQYFVVGNTRIRVTEHFTENGKSIDGLLEDVIRHVASGSDKNVTRDAA